MAFTALPQTGSPASSRAAFQPPKTLMPAEIVSKVEYKKPADMKVFMFGHKGKADQRHVHLDRTPDVAPPEKG